MKCSYRDCDKKIGKKTAPMNLPKGAVVRMQKRYCSEECQKNEVVAEYIDARRTGSERRSSSYPVKSKAFGKALVEDGKITEYQLEKALDLKSMNGRRPLAYYLMKKGWITRRDVLTALAKIHRVPFISLGNRPQAVLLSAQFPFSILYLAGAVPFSFSREQNKICVAMKDPSDLSAVVTLKALSGSTVQVFQGDPVEIDSYLSNMKKSALLTGSIATAGSTQSVAV